MIKESTIDHALNRISRQFGRRLKVRPPVGAAELAELEQTFGPLPRSYTIFLASCNGLRLETAEASDEFHLWGAHDVLRNARAPGSGPPGASMMPVRGEPAGERDWLVTEVGRVHGIVVRWDPWVPGADLLASSFDTYFDCWTRYLSEHFDAQARPRAARRGVQFNARYTIPLDPQAQLLLHDPQVVEWLRQFEVAATGDDFE